MASIRSLILLRPASLAEYYAGLKNEELGVHPGDARSFWVHTEVGTLERRPLSCQDAVSEAAIRRMLWRSFEAVANYLRPVDERHPHNAWIYLCSIPDYTLEALQTTARRDIRRAIRRFRFDFLDGPTLRDKGEKAFRETRTRVGLSDGTPENFARLCEACRRNPAYRLLGAWKDDVLGGFANLTVVDDWATISVFAADEHLGSCPSAGLIHTAIEQLQAAGNCRSLCYGVSSVQEVANVATLDYFKKKVGFRAVSVHRAFVFHPLLHPLVNSVTYRIVRGASCLWPRSRVLRKARGVLASCLGRHLPSSNSTRECQ